MLSPLLHYQPKDVETGKRWLSVLLDLLDADSSQQCRQYLHLIVPKVVQFLEFTREDQLNVKMEIEEEINPYQYDQVQDED